MSIKKIVAPLLFLLALPSLLFAQDPGFIPPPGIITVVGRQVAQALAEGGSTTATFMASLESNEVREELGFSKDQVKKMEAIAQQMQMEAIRRAPEIIGSFKDGKPGAEQTLADELQKKMKEYQAQIDAIATPEQRQKAKVLSFQAVGGLNSPLMNQEMLSALDLTPEQREKATAVFKEREKQRMEMLDQGLKLAERGAALGGPNMSAADREALIAEGQALMDRAVDDGESMGGQFRDFLTPEQLKKAEELLASRPDFLPPLYKKGDSLSPTGSTEWSMSRSTWTPGQSGLHESLIPTKDKRRFPSKGSAEKAK
ncbi:MAG: Spy/CpxP family protein refolding chaperone [Thermoguttaceae bacterium]